MAHNQSDMGTVTCMECGIEFDPMDAPNYGGLHDWVCPKCWHNYTDTDEMDAIEDEDDEDSLYMYPDE